MVVTISHEYGCGALPIARRVAAELAYELVHDQLPQVVATRLGVSREKVEAMDSDRPPLVERLVRALAFSSPEVVGPGALTAAAADAEMIREVERAVNEFAERGDAVMLGRAAGRILIARTDVVRVRLTAPLAYRIAYVAAAFACSEREARAEIERVDAAREAFAWTWYKIDWNDPRLHHLALDTSFLGTDGSADLIVTCVERRASL